jgi:hypothetical protein
MTPMAGCRSRSSRWRVLLVAKPLGLYLLAVYEGRVRWLAPLERLLYRLCGVDPRRPALDPLCGSHAPLQRGVHAAHIRRPPPPASAAAESGGDAVGAGPAGLRARRLIHHEHQLAAVLGRVGDVVLLPDDSADLTTSSRRRPDGTRGGPRAGNRTPVTATSFFPCRRTGWLSLELGLSCSGRR